MAVKAPYSISAYLLIFSHICLQVIGRFSYSTEAYFYVVIILVDPFNRLLVSLLVSVIEILSCVYFLILLCVYWFLVVIPAPSIRKMVYTIFHKRLLLCET